MIFCEKAEKENILEYILYMFQIEDIIKASKYDIDYIQKHIVSDYKTDEENKVIIKQWYSDLIEEMLSDNYKKNKVLSKTLDYINTLNQVHINLANSGSNTYYQKLYLEEKESIDIFRNKVTVHQSNEVYVIFKALYYKILLNLKGKNLNKESEDALKVFTELINILSEEFYKQNN